MGLSQHPGWYPQKTKKSKKAQNPKGWIFHQSSEVESKKKRLENGHFGHFPPFQILRRFSPEKKIPAPVAKNFIITRLRGQGSTKGQVRGWSGPPPLWCSRGRGTAPPKQWRGPGDRFSAGNRNKLFQHQGETLDFIVKFWVWP